MGPFLRLISIQPRREQEDILTFWRAIANSIEKFISSDHENEPPIVVLPEYALGNKIRYPNSNPDTELLDEIKDMTQTLGINLFAGSGAFQDESGWHNRGYFFSYDGKVQHYDKQRLFNYELKLNLIPGGSSDIFLAPPNNIRVQILICSDLWFPELIRGRLPDLPDLLVIPTMSIVPEQQLVGYGRSLWHSLALTRSRENAIPVVVSDWAVQHWSGSSAQNWTCGASSISDPSTRWRTRSEEDQGFLRVESGEATILQSYVSMEKVSEYRKYRRENGLLPD